MVNNFFKGVVHLPSDEAFSILKETGEYSDGNISVKYDPLSWIYITPTLNAITLNSNQTITGRKTFTESIYLANTDGIVDRIAHINNNFIIYSGVSNGLALLNIDEGLGKISAFNKELAFKEDIAAAAGGSIITLNGEIQSVWEVTNSVQRVTDTVIGVAGESRVYGFSRDSDGVPTDGTMIIKTTPTMYGLPRYNDKLNIKSSTPVDELDCVNKQYAENNFLSLTGGTITGNLTVAGNIIQQGETYETHAEKVYSKNDYIYLREGNTSGLAEGEFSGIEFVKYDGTNNGRLVVDNNGIARVGDIGDEQPLATREETPVDGGFAKWDAATNKFITDATNYLPVSGGTTTGTINHNGTLNTNVLSVKAMTYRYKFGPLNTFVGHLACSGVNTATNSTLWTYKLIDTAGKLYSQGNEVALKSDIINYIDATGAASGSLSFNSGYGFTFKTKDNVEYFVYGDGANYSRLYTQIKAADGAMNYYPLMDENGKLYSNKAEVITTAGGTMTGTLSNAYGIVVGKDNSSANNTKGIVFGENGLTRIGASSSLGLYAERNMYFRPGMETDENAGLAMTRTAFYPTTDKSMSLGTTSNYFNNIYGTTIYQNGNKVLDVSGGTMTGYLNLGTSQGFQGTTATGGVFDIVRLINSTRFQVGGSYPSLEFRGKDTRPKYFAGSSTTGTEVALLSDIPTITFDESTGVLTITG